MSQLTTCWGEDFVGCSGGLDETSGACRSSEELGNERLDAKRQKSTSYWTEGNLTYRRAGLVVRPLSHRWSRHAVHAAVVAHFDKKHGMLRLFKIRFTPNPDIYITIFGLPATE